jgi:hypothetical protein
MFIRLCLVMLVLPFFMYAADTTSATVNGIAFNAETRNARLEDLMIINLRTNQGIFGLADGSFTITIQQGDSIVIASTGYEYQKISFKDSAIKSNYFVSVPLKKLKLELSEVAIFSPRDLDSIYKDIKKLGYDESDYTLQGINAVESPITFLYMEFNRVQRIKRHNAERINNEKRRDLLRQLLVNYVSHDIFYLDNREFDDFIDFAQIPEEYMKQASQYDFCILVKRRFEIYQAAKRR